jgi:hypothetical protein
MEGGTYLMGPSTAEVPLGIMKLDDNQVEKTTELIRGHEPFEYEFYIIILIISVKAEWSCLSVIDGGKIS